MMKIRGLLSAFLLAFLVMGFRTQDAADWINGQWQGVVKSWSLAVNSASKKAIFIDGMQRLEGPFTVEEVIGRSVRFRINKQQFTMHFQDKDNATLFVGNTGYWIQRVK